MARLRVGLDQLHQRAHILSPLKQGTKNNYQIMIWHRFVTPNSACTIFNNPTKTKASSVHEVLTNAMVIIKMMKLKPMVIIKMIKLKPFTLCVCEERVDRCGH